VLGTRAGDVHIWKVTEQPSEDVPSVTFIAEATHGDWITAADWTLIKQELFLATGAADGSVKLWKTDAKKLSTVTAVKEINESDMYRVQALSWAPKQVRDVRSLDN
jgi:WD40 repeat protein